MEGGKPWPKLESIQRSMFHLYCAVLGRVQSFLPQLEKADQELRVRLKSQPRDDHNDLDIENVKEGEACIEMVMMIYVTLYNYVTRYYEKGDRTLKILSKGCVPYKPRIKPTDLVVFEWLYIVKY